MLRNNYKRKTAHLHCETHSLERKEGKKKKETPVSALIRLKGKSVTARQETQLLLEDTKKAARWLWLTSLIVSTATAQYKNVLAGDSSKKKKKRWSHMPRNRALKTGRKKWEKERGSKRQILQCCVLKRSEYSRNGSRSFVCVRAKTVCQAPTPLVAEKGLLSATREHWKHEMERRRNSSDSLSTQWAFWPSSCPSPSLMRYSLSYRAHLPFWSPV